MSITTCDNNKICNIEKTKNIIINHPKYKYQIELPNGDISTEPLEQTIKKFLEESNNNLNYTLFHQINNINKQIQICILPIVESA